MVWTTGLRTGAATFLATFVCGSALAATVYVDLNAGGFANGSSWDDAYTTIQDGIDNASNGDETWVAAGTYTEVITMSSGAGLFGGFDGTETSRSERDPDSNEVVIDGTGAASSVVTIDTIVNATISGVTVTNGEATNGGGFFVDSVDFTVTITDCVIKGNSASGDGGGMYIIDSSPDIFDCVLIDNLATSEGGGMFVYNCAPTVVDCVFSGNTGTQGGGGVFSQFAGATPLFRNCVFSGNTSIRGGAFYASNNSSASFTNCTMTGNSGSSWGGAGYINGSSPTFLNCTIANNYAEITGGAIHMFFAGTPELTNCIVYNNTGTAFYETAAGTDITLDTCLVESNPDGDYYDFDTSLNLTGPSSLNALAEVSGTVDGAPAFVDTGASGEWTAAPSYSSSSNRTELTDVNGTYATNELAGKIVNVNTGQRFEALIVSNSENKITVVGDVSGIASGGNEKYAVMNYHLKSTSAAIDVGNATGAPSDDADGDGRPYNALYDIGVDEWGADDADGDGLLTGDEVNIHLTNPNLADSDSDGVDDGDEINVHSTNPNVTDSDDDGLTDGEEVNTYGSNPNVKDSDGDGIEDGDEVNTYGSNPALSEVWLDFTWAGTESGTPAEPYSTMDTALAGAAVNGGIRISGTSTTWVGTINAAVSLLGGGVSVEIGVP